MFRPAIRSSAPAARAVARRFASTQSTGQQATDAAKKASDAAQKYIGSAVSSARNAAGPVGEKVSGLLGAYREPVMYNLRVFGSLLKQVYVAEKLAPPTNAQVWMDAYRTLFQRARDVNYWRQLVQSGEWKRVGVYALEAYGFFKIGEMVGRRHIVGYKLD